MNGDKPTSTPAPSVRPENASRGLYQVQQGRAATQLMTLAEVDSRYRAGTLDGKTLLRKVGTLRWMTLDECRDIAANGEPIDSMTPPPAIVDLAALPKVPPLPTLPPPPLDEPPPPKDEPPPPLDELVTAMTNESAPMKVESNEVETVLSPAPADGEPEPERDPEAPIAPRPRGRKKWFAAAALIAVGAVAGVPRSRTWIAERAPSLAARVMREAPVSSPVSVAAAAPPKEAPAQAEPPIRSGSVLVLVPPSLPAPPPTGIAGVKPAPDASASATPRGIAAPNAPARGNGKAGHSATGAPRRPPPKQGKAPAR
jgi:hypothetical protein